MSNIPMAPASNKASACTNPNPLAAPETSTTLSTRLNSGRRFVVPRYAGVLPLRRAADSGSGVLGGLPVGVALHNLGIAENARVEDGIWERERKARLIARGRILIVGCIVSARD